MATRAKRISKEIEKLEARQTAEGAKLEKLIAQQKRMQENCTHKRGFDLIDGEFVCKECKAIVGFAGSGESEEPVEEEPEDEEVDD